MVKNETGKKNETGGNVTIPKYPCTRGTKASARLKRRSWSTVGSLQSYELAFLLTPSWGDHTFFPGLARKDSNTVTMTVQ